MGNIVTWQSTMQTRLTCLIMMMTVVLTKRMKMHLQVLQFEGYRSLQTAGRSSVCEDQLLAY